MSENWQPIQTAHHDNLSWDTGYWRLHEKPHFWMSLPEPPIPRR